MPEWTNQQKDAIKTRNCDLLISAAAGSGKTAVLSERVLKRITEEGVSVENLLIVTFTDAAAAEMRQRIIDKLRQNLEESPQNTFLTRQLALVPKASITTIHKFCLSIIKNNIHLLDLDPSFAVMDSVDKVLSMNKAAIEAINEMYEKFGKEFSNFSKWLASGKDEQLAQDIINIYNFMESMENPFGWLLEHTEKYNNENCKDNVWIQLIIEKLKGDFSESLKVYNHILDTTCEAGAEKTYEIYKKEMLAIEGIVASLAGGNFKKIKETAICLEFATVHKEKKADAVLCEYAKKLRDAQKEICRENIKKIERISDEGFAGNINKAYFYMQMLYKLIDLFDKKFKEIKKEKNVIDFNDFEHIALNLLQNENLPVAQNLQKKYEEIYVDEYQDCNGVQEAIFSALAKRIDGKSYNMFMVGDVKQSIYKFRNADPYIFVDKLEKYERNGIQQKITMNTNFRSRKEVVESINSLFCKIMSKRTGGVDYTEDEALAVGDSGYIPLDEKSAGGISEVILIDDESEGDFSKIELETLAVANKIKEIISKGLCVFDKDSKKMRPATYKDFAVLLRNPGTKADKIVNIFKNEKIPCFSDKGGGLFDVLEINILICALEITDNSLQDIPLIGLMRSEPVGFTEDELLSIRLVQNKGYFYNALKKYSLENTPLAEKCREFLKMLSKWKEYAKTTSVEMLIGKIIDDISLFAFIETLPGGKNRRGNVELLIEYGRQFEKTDAGGLFSFLRFIEKVEKGSGSETAKMLSDSCDVVRIMSIHKSKGLEFPVVFLINAGGKFKATDWNKGLVLHKTYGIGCNYFDAEKRIKYPLISQEAISYKIKQETISEEMRVLYVALTRAREKLYVVASGSSALKKYKESKSLDRLPFLNEIEGETSFFGWICADINSGNWKVSQFKCNEMNSYEEEIMPSPEQDKVTEEVSCEIDRRLSFKYPHENASLLASKYSVSELKNKFSAFSEEGDKPYSFKEERLPHFMSGEEMTSSAMGTILHLILKFIDFHKEPKIALYNCGKYLVENHFIRKEEFEKAKTQVILEFLNSTVCDEIRSADKLFREIPFNIEVGGDVISGNQSLVNETVLLQGIIDCLYIKGEKFYIVDYKTESKKFTEEELIDIYKNQLKMYNIAAEKITKKKSGGIYLYLLNRGKLVEIK